MDDMWKKELDPAYQEVSEEAKIKGRIGNLESWYKG